MDIAMEREADAKRRQWAERLDGLDISDKEAVGRMVGEVGKWWHSIDLGNGLVTPGQGQSEEMLARVNMPSDLTGKSVIDIGAWDGAASFEAEKRGAARVVAADVYEGLGLMLARRVLSSKVEFVQLDVRKDLPEIGKFDLVLFLGVLYHVPEPILALRRVAELAKEMLIVETDSDLNWSPDPIARVVAGHQKWPDLRPYEAFDLPECNWWLPNRACMELWIEASGFEKWEIVYGPEPASSRLPLKSCLKRRPPNSQQRLVAHCWK